MREELERIINSDHLALYALLKYYSTRHTLIDRLPRSLRELERSTSEILSDFELHTIGGGGVSKLPGFARFVVDAGRIFSRIGGNVAANSSPNRSNALSLFNPFVRFCWRLMEEVPKEARYSSSQQAFGAAVKRALKSNTKA